MKIWITFIGILLTFSALTQRVLDADTNEPIPGVIVTSIYSNGETKAEYTNIEGSFVVDQGVVLIKLKLIGYIDKEINPQRLEGDILLYPALYEIDEAVITGQMVGRNSTTSVQSIRVITAQEIEAINPVTVKDVLELEPSVTFIQDPVLGAQIRLLGMPASQVQILIDGVPVIGRTSGNIDMDQLPISNIERIEIVKGPLSVEYGTDAIAGTINIITKKGNTKSLSARAQYSTIDESTVGLSGAWSWNELGIQAYANRNYFDGVQDESLDRGHSWKPREQYQAGIQVGKSGERWNATIASDWQRDELFIDGNTEFRVEQRPINDSIVEIYEVPFATDQTFTTSRIQNRIIGEFNQNARVKWSGTGAYNWFERERLTYLNTLSTNESTITGNLEDHDTSRFELYLGRMVRTQQFNGENTTWSAGAEFRYEIGSGKRIEGRSQSISEFSGFSSLEHKVGDLTLRPGIRWIYNSGYEAPLIPSLHMRYAKNGHIFRASAARGFRSPELKDLYFFFVDVNHNIRGNADLLAETSWNFQGEWSKRFYNDKGIQEVGIHGFYNEVEDQITLALTEEETGLFQYVNISEATLIGASINYQVHLNRFRASADMQYVARKNSLSSQGADFGNFFGNLQNSASVSYELQRVLTRIEARFNHFADQTTVSVNTEGEARNTEIEGYTIMSCYVHQPFEKLNLNISLGIENLLNVTNINLSGQTSSGVHSSSTGNRLVSPGINGVVRINWTIQ
ncbi:MAG: TonB-dependent receptor plug domain-containing protein [Bacteroidota bacterium]